MKDLHVIRQRLGCVVGILAILVFAVSPFLLIHHEHEHLTECSTCVYASSCFDLQTIDIADLTGLDARVTVVPIDECIVGIGPTSLHGVRAPPAA